MIASQGQVRGASFLKREARETCKLQTSSFRRSAQRAKLLSFRFPARFKTSEAREASDFRFQAKREAREASDVKLQAKREAREARKASGFRRSSPSSRASDFKLQAKREAREASDFRLQAKREARETPELQTSSFRRSAKLAKLAKLQTSGFRRSAKLAKLPSFRLQVSGEARSSRSFRRQAKREAREAPELQTSSFKRSAKLARLHHNREPNIALSQVACNDVRLYLSLFSASACVFDDKPCSHYYSTAKCEVAQARWPLASPHKSCFTLHMPSSTCRCNHHVCVSLLCVQRYYGKTCKHMHAASCTHACM